MDGWRKRSMIANDLTEEDVEDREVWHSKDMKIPIYLIV
jgi:hypothetical protein